MKKELTNKTSILIQYFIENTSTSRTFTTLHQFS